MHDVFISYSHNDSHLREAIVKKLESEGLSCWYAPRDIKPGEDWADAITKALQKCKVLLLIFTGNSNDSDQVLREVSLAVSYRKNIIPVNCDDTPPSGSMQYYLSTLHWMDFSSEDEDTLDELVRLTRVNLTEKKPAETSADHSPVKKTTSQKTIILILLAVLVLNIGLVIFLYSRGIFGNTDRLPKGPVNEQIAEMIRDGVTVSTGEDIRNIDLKKIRKWVIVNNKLYYYNPDNDSPGSDDYLFGMLDDNSIQISDYSGRGTADIIVPEMIDGLPVTVIGEDCFSDNTEIEKVTIPDTVSYISSHAFSGCTNLREIALPAFLEEIGDEAFSDSGLVKIVFPDTFENLGTLVFSDCEQLEDVFFPESTVIIPLGTFSLTPNLKTVTISAASPIIDADAFSPGSGVKLIGVPGSYTEKYAGKMNLEFVPIGVSQ